MTSQVNRISLGIKGEDAIYESFDKDFVQDVLIREVEDRICCWDKPEKKHYQILISANEGFTYQIGQRQLDRIML